MIQTFYIACWKAEGGVYEMKYDTAAGKIISVRKAADGTNTSYFGRDGDILYVLSEIGGPGKLAGKVESFRTAEESLTAIDTLTGIPSGCPHICLANGGKTILSASYTTGAVCSAAVEAGKFGSILSLLEHTGKGPNPIRQESSHAHMLCTTPDGRYLMCVDLGTDELRVYSLAEDGRIQEHGTISTPGGYGPRHMVFSKNGEYIYVVCELQYHLLTYRYCGEGQFELVNDLKINEELPEKQNWGGTIKLAADGKMLFTSNRGREMSSIDLLDLGNPQAPVRVGTFTECSHPRDFLITELEGEKYLILLNMTTDTTAVYQFDRSSYSFRYVDATTEIPMPVCVTT